MSSRQASNFFNIHASEEDGIDHLLPLFVRIQKILRQSSLASDIKHDSDRFDEKVDNSILPLRDENDKRVSAVAKQILVCISHTLHERHVITKLPYNHNRPVHNIYALEIRQFIGLLGIMRKSVENLLQHIDGKYMKPLEIERLWRQIQKNVIPQGWRPYSFQTAFTSLADFIIELIQKVKFW